MDIGNLFAGLGLIINCAVFIWVISSWKKGLQERKLLTLIDVGSDVLGAATRYRELAGNGEGLTALEMREAKAEFKTKSNKLLLLLNPNSEFHTEIERAKNSLALAMEKNSISTEHEALHTLLQNKAMEEWETILTSPLKSFFSKQT